MSDRDQVYRPGSLCLYRQLHGAKSFSLRGNRKDAFALPTPWQDYGVPEWQDIKKGNVKFRDLKMTNSIVACSAEGEILLYEPAERFPKPLGPDPPGFDYP
jgi:hypothetical protein